MKKTILIFSIALMAIKFCNAQKIEIEEAPGGYKYTINEDLMSMKDLIKIMESNQQALELMKKAKTNKTIAPILGFAGGGLIGWSIGTYFGNGNVNWTFTGVGAGLIAIAIPISSSVNKNTKKAVDIHNSSLKSTSFNEFKPDFKVIGSSNGIGLSMSF